MKPKTKKFLKYTLTPQVIPRLQGLFYSGFAYIAFFMAQIYRAVRLLPADHPYLNPVNMGKFGIRHAIVEAGSHLSFKKENIDQIIIYFMMFAGIIMLVAQIFMLFLAGFAEVAYAGLYGSSDPLDFFAYFQLGAPGGPVHADGSTPAATHELAFVLLDRVFGIPGLAGPVGTSFFDDAAGGYSCVVTGQPCFTTLPQSSSTRVLLADNQIYTSVAANPSQNSYSLVPQNPFTLTFPWPYHEALRGMLQVYSVGLLVIGVLIFLYFMFAIVAETTQTGTAFGRRFNHIWAPIRIVVAMGLLVPITYGLNPAQWILMYAVKYGSSFATNGWIIYNNAITGEETLLGPTSSVVARPGNPPVNTLLEFTSVLSVCYEAYWRMYHARATRDPVEINAWLVNPNEVTLAPVPLMQTNFQQALDYFNYGTIVVRFGELRDSDSGSQMWDGEVAPWCGELSLDLPYVEQNMGATGDACGPNPGLVEPGSAVVLCRWFRLIKDLWCSATGGGGGPAGTPDGCAGAYTPLVWPGGVPTFRDSIGIPMSNRHISIFNDPNSPMPTNEELRAIKGVYEQAINTTVTLGVLSQQDSQEWQERLTELGWGGAAIWYNKIAQLNGGLVSSVFAMPTIKKYPFVMEETRKRRAASDDGVSGEKASTPRRGTDDKLPMEDGEEEELVKAMKESRILWHDSGDRKVTGNAFLDAINAIFGTQGLFEITSNEAQNVHPLAQLAAIGRSIVDSAIRNLGYSTAAGLGGGLANLFQQHQIGSFAGAASSFFFQVAMIGLTLGFVLFYIIPFLPFIYFFFAVGGWIKAIFEAMVGVPLWALAHIRIDGEGLPGDAAMGGYYLILEIFLRPILIIFGFIASITIFTAQVQILNEIWYVVVPNVGGANITQAAGIGAGRTPGGIDFVRSAVDEFFFTILYAIICYMMAMGSFKLVDQIPNHILRWMGANVSTFGDQRQDPAQNLVRNAFIGGNMVGDPLKQAAGAAKGIGQSVPGAMGEFSGGRR